MRDRLVELIQNSVNGCAKHWAEVIADHLLDHYRIFNDRSFMCFESNRISVSSDAWSTAVFLAKDEAEKALKGGAEE